MGIRGLPTTYEGYLQLLLAYERERFAFDPANRRVAEASLRIAAATTPGAPLPVVRRVAISLMDEPLRTALGLPRQPAWLGRAVRRALRLRAVALRFAPPRAEPKPYAAHDVPPRLHPRRPRPPQHARRPQRAHLPASAPAVTRCYCSLSAAPGQH